ncbi:MAG: histidine kinase [Casimicrobiaceae bacterium]
MAHAGATVALALPESAAATAADTARRAAPGMGYLATAMAMMQGRIVDVLLLSVAAAAMDFLRLWPQLPPDAPLWTRVVPEIACFALPMFAFIVAGISLAQALPARGWRHVALMMSAALASVGVGLAFIAAAVAVVGLPYTIQAHVVSSFASLLMFIGWERAAMAVGLALYYLVRERDAMLTAQARDAELRRLEVARTMMESRLAILRARVEPEFLFGALDEVQSLYRHDVRAADRMIDALIVYLRAALPQMRGEGSTIGRELDLALAYVAVLKVPRGDTLAIEARSDDAVRNVALPPMVLMPIAQAAFACAEVDARRRFAIVATGSPDGVAIVVEAEGGTRPEAWRGEGPETASRTLKAYFGDAARLEFSSTGTCHRAQILLGPAAPK